MDRHFILRWGGRCDAVIPGFRMIYPIKNPLPVFRQRILCNKSLFFNPVQEQASAEQSQDQPGISARADQFSKRWDKIRSCDSAHDQPQKDARNGPSDDHDRKEQRHRMAAVCIFSDKIP